MKWIYEKYRYCPFSFIEGVEPMKGYVVKGWLIETEDDKDNLILCKRCGNKTSIKECKESSRVFMNGDEVATPTWHLECPFCSHLVGKLEEQTVYTGKMSSRHITGGRIFKNFEKKIRLLLTINEGAEIILK